MPAREKATLYLLEASFEDAAYPGQTFFCRHGALVEGVLGHHPEVRNRLKIERIGFPRPRQAVIAAIGEDLIGKWANWDAPYFAEMVRPASDWRAVLSGMIGEWFGVVVRESGAWAVLQAMSAIPELRERDREAFDRIAQSWEMVAPRRLLEMGGR